MEGNTFAAFLPYFQAGSGGLPGGPPAGAAATRNHGGRRAAGARCSASFFLGKKPTFGTMGCRSAQAAGCLVGHLLAPLLGDVMSFMAAVAPLAPCVQPFLKNLTFGAVYCRSVHAGCLLVA